MGSEVLLRLSVPQAQALTWLTEGASKDQARPTLCSVKLEWKAIDDDALELTAIVTDSYMLATRTLVFEKGTYEALPTEGNVLVPAKQWADALKSTVKVGKGYPLDEMQATIVQLEDDAVSIAAADGSEYKVLKPVDASFPKWRSLVPDNPVTGFTRAEMLAADEGRTAEQKKRHREFKFLLPAISPAIMLRATKILAQPASALTGKNSVPFRWTLAEIDGANLKPSMFTVPNGKQNMGDLMILAMPVRL